MDKILTMINHLKTLLYSNAGCKLYLKPVVGNRRPPGQIRPARLFNTATLNSKTRN
jgi:hypothetical protein